MNKAFQTALSHVGLKEFTSKGKHNPVIVNMFAEIGHEWVKDDETAWCAAFVNYCLKSAKYSHTGKLNARSFLDYGVKTETPTQGDIVVLWRSSRDSWKGHVGFYVSEDEDSIYCLGGNQSNMVNVKAYPKYQLLGYRTFDIAPLDKDSVSFTEENEKLKKEVVELRDDLAHLTMNSIAIEGLAREILKLSE